MKIKKGWSSVMQIARVRRTVIRSWAGKPWCAIKFV